MIHNTYIKSISAENFASFADRIVFTTKSDASKKEYLQNTFVCEDTLLNKVSFIYGANGSGKTYFCKIIREIQRLLEWSPLTVVNNSQLLSIPQLKGMDEPVSVFVFDTAYHDKPVTFAIELVVNGTTYYYEFSVQDKKIISEILTKKVRRTEKLIVRTSPSYKEIVLKSTLKSFDAAKHTVKEEALCLAVAAMLNNDVAAELVEAIREIKVINMTAPILNPNPNRESFSEKRLQKYVKVLQKADPTIRDIRIFYEEEEVACQKIEADNFENREIIANKTMVGVETEHAVYTDGEENVSKPVSFFVDESMGTVKLFTALPYLFDVLEMGGILVIDEIENGLHLSLVKEIIKLFLDPESNRNNAQLICTSHQPLLVDGEIRRDQIWITNKDMYGKCSLLRLSDELKTSRAKVNLSNRILEGALGCNPELFFGNNTRNM